MHYALRIVRCVLCIAHRVLCLWVVICALCTILCTVHCALRIVHCVLYWIMVGGRRPPSIVSCIASCKAIMCSRYCTMWIVRWAFSCHGSCIVYDTGGRPKAAIHRSRVVHCEISVMHSAWCIVHYAFYIVHCVLYIVCVVHRKVARLWRAYLLVYIYMGDVKKKNLPLRDA